ncbi:MAG: hypothetical protein INH41_27685 [Myxococcaceae bacterium]|nr:hypothetical protein [Myxococcaceae bacterium]
MLERLALVAALALWGASCGPARCVCAEGLTCAPATGLCVAAPDAGGRGGDAGRVDAGQVDAGAADAGVGPSGDGGSGSRCGACTLATPLCDELAGRCVRCTASEGCFGETPVCDVSFQQGLGRCSRCLPDGRGCGGATPVCDVGSARCVGCLRHGDCASGTCDLVRQVCADADGGAPGTDAGAADGGGGPACPSRPDAGVVPCQTECAPGFTCQGNECVLNGGAADLQVTLRWDSTDDLDLHLDEPSDGGLCEIWYGSRTPACAAGALDLDSQAGCSMDLVLIENVIYPVDGGRPPSGTYAVRVDHFRSCSSIQWVPFRLEVRKGATTMGLCGVFQPSDPDWSTGGSAGAGRPVMTFTYP